MFFAADNLVSSTTHTRGYAFKVRYSIGMDPDLVQHLAAQVAARLNTLTLTRVRKLHKSQVDLDAFVQGFLGEDAGAVSLIPVRYREWRAVRRAKQKATVRWERYFKTLWEG